MASVWLTATWIENNAPVTGLAPTVVALRLSDNSLVLSQTMTATNLSGSYRYLWTAYDEDEEYLIRADGGSTLIDRYRWGGSAEGDIKLILADTDAIDTRLPSDPADESLQQAAHAQTQADISALDTAIPGHVQTALTNQGYTSVRAALLDFLDASVASRSSHSAADVDTQLSGVHGGGSWEGGTPTAIATAVLEKVVNDHAATAGSLAEAIAIVRGSRYAYVLDGGAGNTNVTLDAQGLLTGGRIRLFTTPAAAAGATMGAADGANGELVAIDLTASAQAPGQLGNMRILG